MTDIDALIARLDITRSYLANHPTCGSWIEARIVENAVAALRELRDEKAAFYMDYRMKCDEQTKSLHVALERAEAELMRLRVCVEAADEMREYAAEPHSSRDDYDTARAALDRP